jgi:hypothetical protein
VIYVVKSLVLYDKIYSVPKAGQKEDIYLRYLKYLNEKVKGFADTKVEIKKLRKYDKRFEILITGPEEIFVSNLLKREIGSIHEFADVKEGQILKGTLVDVGKFGFGLFVDCAILNPEIDILINLHTLRDQLCKGKEKSLKEIVEAYDFINNFPLYVKIIKIDRDKNELQGEIAPDSLEVFEKILDSLRKLSPEGDTSEISFR